MAFNAAISSLTKKVQATKLRQGNVILVEDLPDAGPPTAAATAGRVKNAEVNIEPILSEADSTGRQSTMGYTVVVTYMMMQTDQEGLDAAAALGFVADGETGDNGFIVYVTDRPKSTADAITDLDSTTARDVQGLVFKNALPEVGASLNYSGGESQIPVTFRGVIPAEDFSTQVAAGILVFDAD